MRRAFLMAFVLCFSTTPAWGKWWEVRWSAGDSGARAAAWSEQFKSTLSRGTERLKRACQWLRAWSQKAVPFTDGQAAADRTREFGLMPPAKLDDQRPLVVLIHGLDSGPESWVDLQPRLQAAGRQVAYFNYPNDQSIAQSGELLADALRTLRREHTGLRVDLVTHSMGALVARWFVEGPDYVDGVRRMVLLAPPNHGTTFARWRHGSEVVEHFLLWRDRDEWDWDWPMRDGHGEAGRDLRPGSLLLTQLNARPRRKGVRYTIVAGNRNCGWRYAADAIEAGASKLPRCRGFHWLDSGLNLAASKLRTRSGRSDGLVKLASAELDGVDDVLIVGADHATLIRSHRGEPPAAWPAIKDRLSE
ncbi:MAG TPA: alpha/beta fold hydrolase [Pirellulales bacterium]|nr:alpha/beta fold hydrolase [Pirellulales bacterium]